MWGLLLIAGVLPPSRVTLISASTPHLNSYEIPHSDENLLMWLHLGLIPPIAAANDPI
jgi:hypothetical protein